MSISPLRGNHLAAEQKLVGGMTYSAAKIELGRFWTGVNPKK
jgi:hypothetical protein